MSGSAVVVAAARLLRDHFEQLSSQDRADMLGLLARRAEDLSADAMDLVQSGGVLGRSGEQDRVRDLETAAGISRERIVALEAAALDSEAAALVSDSRILALATEVERLRATRDQAAVIEQAKGVLMRLMHISEDAAFAVLVAASQRDELTLFTVASQITASQDESSST